jgi:outer membrane protein assembly factor BamB
MQRSLMILGLVLVVGSFAGADWPQFRGEDNSGAADAKAVSAEWSNEKADNIAWQADLPGRGVSGPIVVAGKVIVTASSGFQQDRLHVLAFDAASGQKAWERQFWATGRTLCHPTMAVAAPTPASDGQRIFAFYSSNDLACLDLDGNLLWYRGLTHDFPAAANDVGMASSPLVVGDTVVVQVENQGDSFAAGIGAATGDTRWRIERGPAANWTSPAVLRGTAEGEDAVLLQSPSGLTAHHARTGEELWSYPAGCSTIPSVLSADGFVFLPASGLTALRPAGSQEPEVVWERATLAPGSASPAVAGGKIYIIQSGGVLNCGDLVTGEVLWELRLTGSFWATPVVAGDHLFAINQDGLAQVVRISEGEGEVIAEFELGEKVLCSPAAAAGGIFLRSDAHLWKLAGK